MVALVPRPILLVLLLVGSVCASFASTREVVILANSDDPESLELARHYAAAREVPEGNIIALKLPHAEQIAWGEFVSTLFRPLQAELVERGLIDAIAMDLDDDFGRRKYAMSGHRIEALVVCRGVPLKIADDPALHTDVPPFTSNAALRTNAGAVDSELALLAQSGTPLSAFVSNPLFSNETPSAMQLGQVIVVGRLDGPTYADARRLVDQAIEGERIGLIGRAYVDIGGPVSMGDKWLDETAKEIESLGFEVESHRDPGRFAQVARFDAPALYFGWYTTHVDGPFKEPGFQFPPGALAFHIHSFSASTLRARERQWVAPLVARGVTGTWGNVYEPYLQFTHKPQLLMRALARGRSLGEASVYALNAFSWQAILVGDPLYRPFKVPFEDQWHGRDKLPSSLAPYVVLRRIRSLAAQDRGDEALALARTTMRASPSLPLALELARLQQGAGDIAGARTTLGVFALLSTWRPSDVPLMLAAARQLQASDDAKTALAIQRNLVKGELSKPMRIAVLRQGQAVAQAAGEVALATDWGAEAAALEAPPTEAKK